MDLLTPALIGVLLIALTLLVYWVTVFVIVYHLVRFGIGTQPKKIALVFLVGAVGLFFVSAAVFGGLDIQETARGIVNVAHSWFSTNYI